ncbi:MAG: exo-alpha-sialidase [bacterium]|nr:exo-alpha-sialidase [bacterium]
MSSGFNATLLLLFALTPACLHPNADDLEPFLREQRFEQTRVFEKERFPGITVTPRGTVLAFFGSSRLVLRRSEDGGATWGPVITIDGSGIHGGGATVDETTGDILAFTEAGHPPAAISVFRSSDDGRTWSEQETVIHPDPGGHAPSMHMNETGITLKSGRLLRATRYYAGANDRRMWPEHYTNAIYSDDGGRTWSTSAPFPENGTGEAAVAELSDGRVYYNSRVHWDQAERNTRRRAAWSHDGGETWTDWRIVDALPDGHQHRSYGCMGGLVRLPIEGRDVLIFSNLDTPASKRERITVWASFDGGETWPIKRLVFDGPSAYSSLAAGRGGTPSEGWIYLHFEGGPGGASQVARFDLAWILGGEATGDGAVPAGLRPSPDRSVP